LKALGFILPKRVFKVRKKQRQDLTPSLNFEAIPGTIPLEELGNRTSREILAGANPSCDRSNSLTTAINEWYGWVNWTAQNGVAISSSPQLLAHHAGQQLGLDSDRINRILKSVNGDISLEPAALLKGGGRGAAGRKSTNSTSLPLKLNAPPISRPPYYATGKLAIAPPDLKRR
jgi:hypothetical protein